MQQQPLSVKTNAPGSKLKLLLLFSFASVIVKPEDVLEFPHTYTPIKYCYRSFENILNYIIKLLSCTVPLAAIRAQACNICDFPRPGSPTIKI